MKNLKVFSKVKEKSKFKLTRLLGATALTTALLMPAGAAIAEENETIIDKSSTDTIDVYYEYEWNNFWDAINPFCWEQDITGVKIHDYKNSLVTNISVEDYEKIVNSEAETVVIKDNDVEYYINKNNLGEPIDDGYIGNNIFKGVIGTTIVLIIGCPIAMLTAYEISDRKRKHKEKVKTHNI